MTSMRSEIGKIKLDKLFQSRQELNENMRGLLSETTETWGIECERYEVLRIEPPKDIKRSMQLEAEAERLKRKEVILSEAKKQANINIAQGKKRAAILYAEGRAKVNTKNESKSDQIYSTKRLSTLKSPSGKPYSTQPELYPKSLLCPFSLTFLLLLVLIFFFLTFLVN